MASGTIKNKQVISGSVSSRNASITAKASASGGGSTDHNRLVNRDAENQHPIEAITELRAELDSKLNSKTAMPLIDEALSSKAKGLYFDAKKELAKKSFWYLTSEIDPVTKMGTKESIISGPYDLGAGGGSGGGGGVTNVKVSQVNWPETVVVDAKTEITINWLSTIGDPPERTGAGTIYLSVNSKQVEVRANQPQGDITFDISPYLIAGPNTIQVRVLDLYGTTGITVGTINAVTFKLASDFDGTLPYTGNIEYSYTPWGNVNKTVYFELDGQKIGTQFVKSTGALQPFTIPSNLLSHGAHLFEVYFTAIVNGNMVESNRLVYNLIWYNPNSTLPIIASTFPEKSEQEQYFSFNIPYRVYVPNKNIFDVKLSVDGREIKTLKVNTATQFWEYKSNSAHENPEDYSTLTIACGLTSKNFRVRIKPSKLIIIPEEANQLIALSATGRTNTEPLEERAIWQSITRDASGAETEVNCTLENFNWGSNGWVKDSDGNTVLRVSGDARVKIPYQPFATDFKSTGKTIEFEIATSVVQDYSSTIIKCLDKTDSDTFKNTASFVDLENRKRIFSVDCNYALFKEKAKTTGLHIFSYLPTGWTYNGNIVDLVDYGINLTQKDQEQDVPADTPYVEYGDSITIEYTSAARGFYMTPQAVYFQSMATAISAQYKENEHIRVSFVIEPASTKSHIIWVYLNGVAARAIQYSTLDSFQQITPNIIEIGSNEAVVDIYNIRIYNTGLTSRQIVNNWIADTQNAELRVKRYQHNDNYNDNNELTIDGLPDDLPYIIWDIDPLPEFKGDKRLGNATYVDPTDSSRNFTSTNAQYNVQGTSSAVYPVKNIRIKFKAKDKDPEFSWLDNSDNDIKKFPITYPGGIGDNYFTYKVDYASSEGANNVELVRLYNDLTREYNILTPPQKQNPQVRVGIDGFPIVAFHQDANDNIVFHTKANFNNDKANEDVYGFEDGDESWEITNNTALETKFKVPAGPDNFSKGFEARFPDLDDGYGNKAGELDKLFALTSWISSTDRTAATNNELEKPLTVTRTEVFIKEDGDTGVREYTVTHTHDTADYRLDLFRLELTDHFDLKSTLLYYVFTSTFLMIDSRAKNAFPTYYKSRTPGDGGDKWFWLPYDMDTALGINNMGELVFDYSLEDTDYINGAGVFNGQDSVMWSNVRDAFSGEIAALYEELRISTRAGQDSLFSYSNIEKMFDEHQGKWSANIFNQDAYNKYVIPLIGTATTPGGINYLEMLQGNKAEQRKWWLYNRFKYMDSKYNAGEAKKNYVQFRAFVKQGLPKPNIEITPYADIYATVNWANGLSRTERALLKNGTTIIQNPFGIDNVMNEQEVYIYSADQLKSFGDISGFYPSTLSVKSATKLQSLKVGDGAEDYVNPNLSTIELGANTFLKSIDARNCVNFTGSIAAEQCSTLENLLLTGSQATTVTLPKGGNLKTLHLPETLTVLNIIDHPLIQEIRIEGASKISKLWIENTPLNKFYLGTKVKNMEVDQVSGAITKVAKYEYADEASGIQDLIKQLPRGAQVRLLGINETMSTAEEVKAFYDYLDTNFDGIDHTGAWVDKPQIEGKIRICDQKGISKISYAEYSALRAQYPEVEIDVDQIFCTVIFDNEDNNQVETKQTLQNTTVTAPETPTKKPTIDKEYMFVEWHMPSGEAWSESTIITEDVILTPIFTHKIRSYTIHFDTDSSEVVSSVAEQTVEYGSYLQEPTLSKPDGVTLIGWFTSKDASEPWDFNKDKVDSALVSQTTTLIAKYTDGRKPIVLTERLGYNKFKLVASDNFEIAAFAVVHNNSNLPTEWTSCEPTTKLEEVVEITAPGDWYIWVKDRNGNVNNIVESDEFTKVTAYSITSETLPNSSAVQVEFYEQGTLVSNFALAGTQLLYNIIVDDHYKDLIFKVNGEDEASGSLVVTKDIKAIAAVTPKDYTVHFNLTNSDPTLNTEPDQIITYLYKVLPPASQFYKGTVIDGWYIDEQLQGTNVTVGINGHWFIDGSDTGVAATRWDFATDVVTENLTLVARWVPKAEPTRIKIKVEGKNVPVNVKLMQKAAHAVKVNFGDQDADAIPNETNLHLFATSEEFSYGGTSAQTISHLYNTGDEIQEEFTISIWGPPDGYTLGAASANSGEQAVNPISAVIDIDFSYDIDKTNTYAFMGASITELKLTPYMREIASGAFMNCTKLVSVEIPKNIKKIRSSAFEKCKSLAGDLYLHKDINLLGSSAFRYCSSLNSITFEDGFAADISDNTFRNCDSLTKIIIPKTVSKIYRAAFAQLPLLEKVILLNKDLIIDANVFNGCPKIKSAGPYEEAKHGEQDYNIEFSWKENIPGYAFYGADYLESIKWPANLKSIGYLAFGASGVRDSFDSTEFILPETLKEIGSKAFYFASRLTKINLPASIESLGNRAFEQCYGLADVTINFYSSTPLISSHDGWFKECSQLLNSTVPKVKVKNYPGITTAQRFGDYWNEYSYDSNTETSIPIPFSEF